MAKVKRKNSPAETNGDSGFVIEPESNAVVVRVPVKFYRRNGRQMILAKDDASGTNQHETPTPNNAFASNMAKAWSWQEQLESGEYSSFEELGRANNVDRTYVSRILRLTSLAPNTVEDVIHGKQNDRLSLRYLLRGVALLWCEQQKDH